MLVTDDSFKLKVETRSTFCVLKLLSKAVVVAVVVTLVLYLLFIYLFNVTISKFVVL
jgi:hypothetical protein